MNPDRLFSMLVRMVMRKAVNKGLDAGIDKMSKGSGRGSEDSRAQRPAPRSDRKRAGHLKRSMRLARRIGRF
ncbi:hypothetical protein [Rhodosalinus sp. 5P4]|uniref:hypothetical protein n=1 Tax=Rhodosalinus sp. 5P4 TaxID=3239196 RepID=UPI0035247B4C